MGEETLKTYNKHSPQLLYQKHIFTYVHILRVSTHYSTFYNDVIHFQRCIPFSLSDDQHFCRQAPYASNGRIQRLKQINAHAQAMSL